MVVLLFCVSGLRYIYGAQNSQKFGFISVREKTSIYGQTVTKFKGVN